MGARPDGVRTDAAEEGARPDRRGFTLLEVMIALVILAVGALGLAATTLHVVRRATIADLKTERVTARRAALEMIQATPYDDVGTGADTLGRFVIEWSVVEETGSLKELAVVTVGPATVAGSGTGAGAIRPDVRDTITYSIVQP